MHNEAFFSIIYGLFLRTNFYRDLVKYYMKLLFNSKCILFVAFHSYEEMYLCVCFVWPDLRLRAIIPTFDKIHECIHFISKRNDWIVYASTLALYTVYIYKLRGLKNQL